MVHEHLLSVLPCRSALAKQNQQRKLANPWPDELQLAQLPHWKKPIMTHLTNDIFSAMLREHRSL